MSNASQTTSRASRELLVRLAQTLKGHTDLFDAVYIDPLHPQLLNRKAFDRVRLDPDLAGTVFAVTYADADGLKALNDSEGHDVGDCLLQDIVDTWTLAVRSWDRADSLIFRLGGDEFAVLWFEDDDNGPERLQAAWDAFRPDSAEGVTSAWVSVHGGEPTMALARAVTASEEVVRDSKAGSARTEVEALRARVAELEAACDRYRDRALAEQEVRREAQRAQEEGARRIAELEDHLARANRSLAILAAGLK